VHTFDAGVGADDEIFAGARPKQGRIVPDSEQHLARQRPRDPVADPLDQVLLTEFANRPHACERTR
jgi:hypothetical protein